MRNFITFLVLVIVTAMWCLHTLHASSAPPPTIKPIEPYVYVEGAVHKPGRYDWFAGMTVVDAIDAAGGFTDSAARRFKIFHIDGGAVSVDRDTVYVTNKPPILKAGDMISVPKRIF